MYNPAPSSFAQVLYPAGSTPVSIGARNWGGSAQSGPNEPLEHVHDVLDVEGLPNVRCRPARLHGSLDDRRVGGRDEDDGSPASALAVGPAEVRAGHARQAEVEDDRGRALAHRDVERGHAVARGPHAIALVAEQALEQLANIQVVLGDHDQGTVRLRLALHLPASVARPSTVPERPARLLRGGWGRSRSRGRQDTAERRWACRSQDGARSSSSRTIRSYARCWASSCGTRATRSSRRPTGVPPSRPSPNGR